MRYLSRVLGAVLAAAMVAAVVVSVVPVPTLRGTRSDAPGVAPNVPVWSHAAAVRFPDCGPVRDGGPVPVSLIAVRTDGSLARVSLDDAIRAAHTSDDGFDLWVVGECNGWRLMPHSLARVGHAGCLWRVGETTLVRCPDGYRTTS